MAPVSREPGPDEIDAAQRLLEEIRKNPIDQALYNKYSGFCLRNNMLKQAIRALGEIVDDESVPIEGRRAARLSRDRLVRVIAIPQPSAVRPDRPSLLWLGLLLPAALGIIFGLGLTLWIKGPWRIFGGILLAASTAVLAGYYIVWKKRP